MVALEIELNCSLAILRPKFSDILRNSSSCLPGNELLKWLEEDEAVLPETAQLGADFLCGEELYKDLRTLYMEC